MKYQPDHPGRFADAGHARSVDEYFRFILEKLKRLPFDDGLRDYILKEIRLGGYSGRSFLVIRVAAQQRPVAYDSKYYVRNGPSNEEIPPEKFGMLFQRFVQQ